MNKFIPLFTCSFYCGLIFFIAILYLCCQSMYNYIVYCLSYNHLLDLSSTAIYTFRVSLTIVTLTFLHLFDFLQLIL